ncbi:MAG: DUF1080 domain-containing protein [Verrucomicrobia bacterium]|nr:DUF1080 domain-containing protein [Verrucomicrobiota bacterium]
MIRLPNFPQIAATAIFTSFTLLGANAADKKNIPTWTDVAKAAADDSDFVIQGEYLDGKTGVQIVALSQGKFYVSKFTGGLPGAGWNGSKPEVATFDRSEVKKQITSLKKVTRESPTIGAKPPKGAVVLFDGKANALIKGEVKDGLLWAGSETTGEYGDFHLHVEFRLPYKPSAPPSSQDRGNSGLYLQNRYETQVLDTFGLVFNKDWIDLPLQSEPKQWCGSFYKVKTPDTPMCLPPLTWQTYDIDFTAPKFDKDGKKIANTRITIVHNGVKIHDDVEMPIGTGAGAKRPEVPKGPIVFQGHGNPTAYRNVWLVEK